MTEDRVVILTALSLEYDEVRAGLRGLTTRVHPSGTRFEVGRLDSAGCLVALALTGKGNLPAATLTERAIAQFSPAAVIFVGVAGALRRHVTLGDVVVATHVYAYHGATSEDDGTRARPRVWESAHSADQAARHVARVGAWARPLPADGQPPRVHFGPIAAGERVLDSAISADALWIREHYNDALSIEMEAAGVAQAGHLNDSLPVAVVRGISDRADGTKAVSDSAGWQPRAAARAAAFAIALAAELGTGSLRHRPAGSADQHPAAPTTATNLATGHAQVGFQAGQIFGGVHLRTGYEPPDDLPSLLADLRRELNRGYRAGRVDEEVRQAALEELDVATTAARDRQGKQLVVAVKRLSGLIGDLAEFGAKLAAITSAVRGMS
jgi:adenosylhomocysteine nucleosidase